MQEEGEDRVALGIHVIDSSATCDSPLGLASSSIQLK